MSCEFDREIIQKYADNTIDPLEFIFLKEHINYCVECRNELEMVMALENELYKFFVDDSEVGDLESMITTLVDDCMRELNKRERLKYMLNSGMQIGSRIMVNSLKFLKFIPGSKAVSKGTRRTASFTGKLIKKEARKLWGYTRC